jgi:glycosyltransferase 2 family protein
MQPPPSAGSDAHLIAVRQRRSALIMLATGTVYLAVLLLLDRSNGILARLAQHGQPLIVCGGLVLASFVVRHQRWRMALQAQGQTSFGWLASLRAYIAGFAFTVSPGKAGELVRMRYFARMSVPPAGTVAAFIYERGLDLAVLVVLSIGASSLVPAFGILAWVVLAFLTTLCAVACWPRVQPTLTSLASHIPGVRIRTLAYHLVEGLALVRPLLRPKTLINGAALGTLAWLLTAAAFAWLCHSFDLRLTWQHALGIYPLAMLAGAISFVPGGVGTTEAAIVLMLTALGIPLDVSLTVAVGIRLATLWLAILLGMLAMISLEVRSVRAP